METEKFAPLNLNPGEIIEYTYEWKGERFADGRPKVPDSLLERVGHVTLTQAWGVLRNEGYHWQYEDGFVCTHPGQTLVGRALTAMYVPRRPDMRALMEEKGARLGCIGGTRSRGHGYASCRRRLCGRRVGNTRRARSSAEQSSRRPIYCQVGQGCCPPTPRSEISSLQGDSRALASFVVVHRLTLTNYHAGGRQRLPSALARATVMPGRRRLGQHNGRPFSSPPTPRRERGQDFGSWSGCVNCSAKASACRR